MTSVIESEYKKKYLKYKMKYAKALSDKQYGGIVKTNSKTDNKFMSLSTELETDKSQAKKAFTKDLGHSYHTVFDIKIGNDKFKFINCGDAIAYHPNEIPASDPIRDIIQKLKKLNMLNESTEWTEFNNIPYPKIEIPQNLKCEFLDYTNVSKYEHKNHYAMLTTLERKIFQRIGFLDASDIKKYPKDFLKLQISDDDARNKALNIIDEDYKDFLNDSTNYDDRLERDYNDTFQNNKYDNYEWVNNNIFKMWSFYLYIILKKIEYIDRSQQTFKFSDLMNKRIKKFMKGMQCFKKFFESDEVKKAANRDNSHLVSYMFTYLINLQLKNGFIVPDDNVVIDFRNTIQMEGEKNDINYVMLEAPYCSSLDPNQHNIILPNKVGKQLIGVKLTNTMKDNYNNANLTKDQISTLECDNEKNSSFKFLDYDIHCLHGNSNADVYLKDKIKLQIPKNRKCILFMDSNLTVAKLKKKNIEYSNQISIIRDLAKGIKAKSNVIKNIQAVIGKYQIKKSRPRIGFANEQMNKAYDIKTEQDGMVLFFINFGDSLENVVTFQNAENLCRIDLSDITQSN